MDYFKHYSTASDSKLINHLFDEYKHTGYAYWFLLLELCAENWDGKSKPSFKFHTRIVRQKLRISHTKLEHLATFLSSFSDVLVNISKKEIEIDIPKLAEVKTSRSVIKSNKKRFDIDIDIDIDIEARENKALTISTDFKTEILETIDPVIKPTKKTAPKKRSLEKPEVQKSSPLAILFKPDDEIQSWLIGEGSSVNVQKELLETHSHHVLAEEVKTAFQWQMEPDKPNRNAGLYLKLWMKNKKASPLYNPVPKRSLEDDLEAFFKEHAPQNEAI
jgi:hypothetical protein